MGTLVVFRIAGWPAEAALDELGSRVFAIARTIPSLDAIRISVGFFNAEDELERFAGAVELLAAHTPEHPAAAPAAHDPRRSMTGDPPPRRSWAAIRWRQFRHAPRPVVRAVAASLSVATVLAAAYLAYDVALSRGAVLPGGDLRTLAVTAYVVIVLVSGSLITWLVVPQPTGSGTVVRRSAWSAALGLFAAVPVAYLVLVAAVQLIRPLIG